MQGTISVNAINKAECVQFLTERLDKMPVDVLRYISGAVDLAGMLDAAKLPEKEQAS